MNEMIAPANGNGLKPTQDERCAGTELPGDNGHSSPRSELIGLRSPGADGQSKMRLGAAIACLIDRFTRVQASLDRLDASVVALATRSAQADQRFEHIVDVVENIASDLGRRWVQDQRLREFETRHFRDNVFKPFVNCTIRLIDQADQDIAAIETTLFAGDPVTDPCVSHVAQHYFNSRSAARIELLNMLAAYDIEAIEPPVRAPFDPRQHHRAKGRETRVPQDVGRIAECLRPGYQRASDNWVIRSAAVVLFELHDRDRRGFDD